MHCRWTPLRQFNEQCLALSICFVQFPKEITLPIFVSKSQFERVLDKIIRATFIRGAVIWENVPSFDTFSRKGQLRETLSYLSLSPLQTLRLITESGTWAKEMKLPDPLPPPRRECLEIHLFYPFLCFYLAREPLNASLCPVLHYQNFINAPFYTPLASAHLYYYYHYYCY